MFPPHNPNQFAETGKGVVLPDLAYMMEENNTGTAGDSHLFPEGHVSMWEGGGHPGTLGTRSCRSGPGSSCCRWELAKSFKPF